MLIWGIPKSQFYLKLYMYMHYFVAIPKAVKHPNQGEKLNFESGKKFSKIIKIHVRRANARNFVLVFLNKS